MRTDFKDELVNVTSSGTDSNITFFIFCSFVLIEGHDLLRNFRCKIFARGQPEIHGGASIVCGSPVFLFS